MLAKALQPSVKQPQQFWLSNELVKQGLALLVGRVHTQQRLDLVPSARDVPPCLVESSIDLGSGAFQRLEPLKYYRAAPSDELDSNLVRKPEPIRHKSQCRQEFTSGTWRVSIKVKQNVGVENDHAIREEGLTLFSGATTVRFDPSPIPVEHRKFRVAHLLGQPVPPRIAKESSRALLDKVN
jgi:hypothetical protein